MIITSHTLVLSKIPVVLVILQYYILVPPNFCRWYGILLQYCGAVYEVYLRTIKFDEFKCNANWQTFSLATRTILRVDCLTNAHNTCDYN